MANEVLITGWVGSKPKDYPARDDKERFVRLDVATNPPNSKNEPNWIAVNAYGEMADLIVDGSRTRKGDMVPGERSAKETLSRLTSPPCDPVVETRCPFCDVERAGRYDKRSCRFVCVNPDCTRCANVVDYSAYVAERDRLTDDFFAEFPGLAHAEDWSEIKKLTEQLLRKGVEPHLALQLVAAWNEVFARPPMSTMLLIENVDWVAASLRDAA